MPHLCFVPLNVLKVIGKHYGDWSVLRSKLVVLCKCFMDLLEEEIYAEIHLNEQNGGHLLAIGGGPRERSVRRIVYTPKDPRPRIDVFHEPGIELSTETIEALETLYVFPNLATFSFDLRDYWNIDDWEFGVEEFWGLAQAKKSHEPWRILLENSFAALARFGGGFKNLEIYHLPPLWDRTQTYSTFRTEQWRELLQGIELFDFKLPEIPMKGINPNLTNVHRQYLGCLADDFLHYLPNVQSLRVCGGENACIGGD